MDQSVAVYRMEKAKRGLSGRTQTAAKPPAERLRRRFLERLALLKREQSLRDFAAVVGLPHSTIASWSNDPNSQPNMLHLQAIAQKAELPGVSPGRLSIDWLCGLSDEPSRDARAEVGQLPGALARHVVLEVGRRLPRTGLWGSFASYWRIDGDAIIAQAIERILECFRRGSEGLDELAKSEKVVIEELVDLHSPVWSQPGQTPEQHKATLREEERRQRGLVERLVSALTHGEFVRRINASGAPLIYDPDQLDRQRAALMNPEGAATSPSH